MLSVALATPLQSISAQSPNNLPQDPVCAGLVNMCLKSIMSSLI